MKFLKLLFTSFACFLFFFGIVGVDGSAAEKRLFETLLKDLNPLERPILNEGEPVRVTFGVTLMRITNVDIEKYHIDVTLWLSMEWKASNLVWDPEQFSNISAVRVPVERIWMPDIFAYNQVGENFDPFHKTMVVLKNNGTVAYIPPGHATTSCTMDINKYPFEELNCQLKFGSWTHDGHELDLEMQSEDGGDLSSFVKNPEWEVLGFPGKKTSNYYTCCPEPYVDVTFTLKLKRRGESILSSAKVMIFVITGFLFMSALLVPSSAFKILFGLCALFLCAYSTTTYNPSPGKHAPPEIAIYFGRLFFVSFSVLFTNLLTYHIFYKLGAAPELIKKLLAKSPIQRPKFAEFVTDRRDTLTPHEENYNDLQELTIRSRQLEQNSAGVSDWKYFSILLDKFFFIFWIVFIFIFHLAAYPSFDTTTPTTT